MQSGPRKTELASLGAAPLRSGRPCGSRAFQLAGAFLVDRYKYLTSLLEGPSLLPRTAPPANTSIMLYRIFAVLALAVTYAAAEKHIVTFDNK